MGLNALLNPGAEVQEFASGRTLGRALYKGDFDKRSDSLHGKITKIATTVTNWTEEIGKLAGVRNPMYMIGDVSKNILDPKSGKGYSEYIPDQVKGMVRAISQFIKDGVSQQGVIIDGIGDVSSEIGIEMPSNPFMYREGGITDQRYRKPNIVKMRVMVSNYLQDGLVDTLIDGLSGLDPTGLTKNMLSDGGNTRAQQALYKLRYIQEKGTPFTLHTPHGIYENMMIKTIRPRTTERSMDMLDAELEFSEVVMYTTLANFKSTMERKVIEKTSSEYDSITNWDWVKDAFKETEE